MRLPASCSPFALLVKLLRSSPQLISIHRSVPGLTVHAGRRMLIKLAGNTTDEKHN